MVVGAVVIGESTSVNKHGHRRPVAISIVTAWHHSTPFIPDCEHKWRVRGGKVVVETQKKQAKPRFDPPFLVSRDNISGNILQLCFNRARRPRAFVGSDKVDYDCGAVHRQKVDLRWVRHRWVAPRVPLHTREPTIF